MTFMLVPAVIGEVEILLNDAITQPDTPSIQRSLTSDNFVITGANEP
jgi:hypothetical protein